MKHFLLLLLAINCYAQSPIIEWQKSFGGSESEFGSSIAQTSDGGYISIGSTDSSEIIPFGNYHGNGDVYVVKTNNIGNIEWQKTIGGSESDVGTSVIQTLDNCYIISGRTDSSDGDFTLNQGLSDCFMIKLDFLGNIIWQRTFGGSQRDELYDLCQANDDGFILAGLTRSSDGQVSQNQGLSDGWVIKTNALGFIEWEKSLGGSSIEFIVDIITTSDNGYVFVGLTNSNDGDILQNQGDTDAWIVKLNNTGTTEWQKTYGGSGYDALLSIQQTTDGGYITCGESESNDGNLSNNSGATDSWILKLNASGEVLWNTVYGGPNDDSFNQIVQTTSGDFVFGGKAEDFDSNPNKNEGYGDCWIVKMSSNGDLIWSTFFGGSNFDNLSSMIKTVDNGYIFVGSSKSNNGDVLLNNGLYDIWMVKLTPEQLSNSSFQEDILTVFPNPTENMLNIQTSKNNIFDFILITDSAGKIIVEETLKSNKINTLNIPSGMYLLQLKANNKTYQTKFIKK